MEYDYLVVGAGSGGCALAARLADALPERTIALLEAGPDDHHWLVKTPLGLAGLVPFKSARNWAFHTTPQPALDGRRGYQPRGRGLGGSSSINAMIYTRGHPLDYDAWADAGCPGWRWQDVLPYFKRAEHNERGADAWHGTQGPLNVADLRSPNPFSMRFVEAGRQAGFAVNGDFNGASQEGVGLYQVTQKNGERWNAARAYLHGRTRQNLHVMTGTSALRIVFEGRRAVGVEVQRGGRRETLRARAEVVLAAGAFNSPQLLMCSGIGPTEHLQSLGIPALVEAPGVGANLQDHLDVIINKCVPSSDLIGFSPAGIAHLSGALFGYLRERRGVFSSNVAEAGGFLSSQPGLDRPDLQLHFLVGISDDHNRKLHVRHGFSCHVCVLRPKSRGNVTLASADARQAPVIDPRFLSEPEDLEGLLRGLRIVRKILAAPALAEFGGKELYSQDVQSDDGLRALIRARADTIYHPVGTCRMGSDAAAVVDPQLRVRGVERLRVVDASVMPTLIGGNTNAPTIMIAEKAADLMRHDAS